MYNPELLGREGLHIGHFIVGFVYSIYIIIKLLRSRDPSHDSHTILRMLLLGVFLGFCKACNYYDSIIFGIYILLFLITLCILVNEHQDVKLLILEFGCLFVLAGVIFYLAPIYIYSQESNTEVLLNASDVILCVPFICLPLLINLRDIIMGRPLALYRFCLFIFILLLFCTVVIVTAILNVVSHIWYGLFFMYTGITTKKFSRIDKTDSKYIFMAGTIIALDDIIGYNVFPHCGYTLLFNAIVWPALFALAIVLFFIK